MMDSGNSSSMQSSSGGDDQEYDSRSFFHHPPPPQQQQPTASPFVFSPDPNLLQPFPDLRDPVFLNWANSGPIARPDETNHYLSFPGSSSSALPPPTTAPQPPAPAPQPPPPKKNPKKRTRASRRAPTTVLTTDTSNFRAMVQEFTGIPAPPFSAAASATSAYSRLLGGSSFRGGSPFRPSAQRYNTSQSSSMTSSSTLMNIQHQLPGSGQQMGMPSLSGQPDPFMTFQSLLQQTSSSLLPPPNHHRQQLGSLQRDDTIARNTGFGTSSDEQQLSTFMGIQSQGGNDGSK